MKNNEFDEIREVFDKNINLLESFFKILQKSANKRENLKEILTISKDSQDEPLFNQIYQQLSSGLINLESLTKQVQRRLSQMKNTTNEKKVINDDEAFLLQKYSEIINRYDDINIRIEVTKSLISLLQKSISIKKIYDYMNDNKFNLLREKRIDLSFLNEDLSKITLFTKILQKKSEELKSNMSKSISTNPNNIQILSSELIKEIKENKEKFPYFTLNNIEFTYSCFLLERKLFYFISYRPSESTFNFYVNENLTQNTELSFGNLNKLYGEEPFFKDFQFHRDSYSQETFTLKYLLNLNEFKQKVFEDYTKNTNNCNFQNLNKKQDYFNNKVIFIKDKNLLMEGPPKLALEITYPYDIKQSVFTFLISSSKLQIECLRSLSLV